ncbi:surface-adhesin E family protein [Noviherbaspirillum malthae]|uniref:surface-adhesin E family protein n=1 Tax=Noviherbaspirillum malthae TaxID=1260987 RepID=UPI00188F81F2|nr:surface-adhesin E family protein [Noviherbaspirillum malthae]
MQQQNIESGPGRPAANPACKVLNFLIWQRILPAHMRYAAGCGFQDENPVMNPANYAFTPCGGSMKVQVQPSAESSRNGMFKNKIAAGMMLLAACGLASAKWIKVAETEGDTFYYESSMVRKAGKYMRLWHLIDHSEVKLAARGPYKSSKVQIELECRENRWRVTYLTYHSERMGAGSLLDSFFDPNAVWEPMVPNSPIEKISEGICKG